MRLVIALALGLLLPLALSADCDAGGKNLIYWVVAPQSATPLHVSMLSVWRDLDFQASVELLVIVVDDGSGFQLNTTGFPPHDTFKVSKPVRKFAEMLLITEYPFARDFDRILYVSEQVVAAGSISEVLGTPLVPDTLYVVSDINVEAAVEDGHKFNPHILMFPPSEALLQHLNTLQQTEKSLNEYFEAHGTVDRTFLQRFVELYMPLDFVAPLGLDKRLFVGVGADPRRMLYDVIQFLALGGGVDELRPHAVLNTARGVIQDKGARRVEWTTVEGKRVCLVANVADELEAWSPGQYHGRVTHLALLQGGVVDGGLRRSSVAADQLASVRERLGALVSLVPNVTAEGLVVSQTKQPTKKKRERVDCIIKGDWIRSFVWDGDKLTVAQQGRYIGEVTKLVFQPDGSIDDGDAVWRMDKKHNTGLLERLSNMAQRAGVEVVRADRDQAEADTRGKAEVDRVVFHSEGSDMAVVLSASGALALYVDGELEEDNLGPVYISRHGLKLTGYGEVVLDLEGKDKKKLLRDIEFLRAQKPVNVD